MVLVSTGVANRWLPNNKHLSFLNRPVWKIAKLIESPRKYNVMSVIVDIDSSLTNCITVKSNWERLLFQKTEGNWLLFIQIIDSELEKQLSGPDLLLNPECWNVSTCTLLDLDKSTIRASLICSLFLLHWAALRSSRVTLGAFEERRWRRAVALISLSTPQLLPLSLSPSLSLSLSRDNACSFAKR